MSVRTLSNHYETLRVSPTASTKEIADAFASQMRTVRVRPDMTVAQIGELSLAYETLRDPAKRSAYDELIGLKPKPPQPQPSPLNIASFVAGSYGPARIRQAPPPPKTEPARPDVAEEPRVSAFIAASSREPSPAPAPEPEVAPEPQPAPELRTTAAAEWPIVAPRPALIDRQRANIGASVIGLAVLALAVSVPKTNGDRLATSAAPAQAVTVGLPPPTPVQDYVVPPQVAAADPQQAAPIVAQAEHSTTPEEQQPEAKAAEVAATIAAPVTTAAADPLAPAPAADEPSEVAAPAAALKSDARMPLPNATIARTIERIGYSCGSVNSVVADAGPGVFKITCSSGDSYRAAPTGGRYHFRKWDRR